MSRWTVAAAFPTPEEAISAARAARGAGYRDIDILSPFSLEDLSGIDEALGHRPSRVRPIMLAGAGAGAAAIFALQAWSAVFDYPINSGGRALFSWPAFVVPTFEVGVLGAAVAGFVAVLVGGALPQLHHPIFAVAGIEHATQDLFFVVLADDGDEADRMDAVRFLERSKPSFIREASQ